MHSEDFVDPLEWLRQIGAPEGSVHEWERAHRAALAERERLREELGEAEHQIATCDQAVLREALLEGVLAARALGTPVCEDGFRHCCGGPRSGCRDSCANKFLVEWAKRHAALSGRKT